MSAPGIDHEDRIRRLRRMHGIARLMDTAIRIPGTGVRLGADSILGLLPGVGDAGAALVGLFLVNEARQLGVPPQTLLRMLGNLGVDTIGGSVPLLGDIFDVYFKSNRRNLNIVLDHFGISEEELLRTRRRT